MVRAIPRRHTTAVRALAHSNARNLPPPSAYRLFANFWWMTGEAHDYAYPDSPSISDRHNDESAYMLEAACVWLSVYYLIVVPVWGQITKDPKAVEEYDDGEFKPRFSYFKNFRQYENIHTLFWLCKDLAWNRNNISMWFVFLWPTVGIAGDLLYASLIGKVRVCISAMRCGGVVDSTKLTLLLSLLSNITSHRTQSSTLPTSQLRFFGYLAMPCGRSASSLPKMTRLSSCGM